MKEACRKTGMSYEALKFYCNQGLVPNVKRDRNNYRVFDDRDIRWLEGLLCLKRCGMSIRDMKVYMQLCLQGKDSIQARKDMLDVLKETILDQMEVLRKDLAYIDGKQQYYDDVLAGKVQYSSNLIRTDEE